MTTRRRDPPPELRGAAILVFVIFLAFVLGYMLGSAMTIETWCAT